MSDAPLRDLLGGGREPKAVQASTTWLWGVIIGLLVTLPVAGYGLYLAFTAQSKKQTSTTTTLTNAQLLSEVTFSALSPTGYTGVASGAAAGTTTGWNPTLAGAALDDLGYHFTLQATFPASVSISGCYFNTRGNVSNDVTEVNFAGGSFYVQTGTPATQFSSFTTTWAM
jgi:hypothetical protein